MARYVAKGRKKPKHSKSFVFDGEQHCQSRKSVRKKLHERQDGDCFYCGNEIEIDRKWKGTKLYATVDHIVPQAKGGRTVWENISLACRDCNNLKGDMTPLEFLRALCITTCRVDALRGGGAA